MYVSYPESLSRIKCLSPLADLLSSDQVTYFTNADTHLDRVAMDGIITFTANIGEKKVGIVWTDFRVSGGSFATKNSQRLSAFIRHLNERGLPLIFYINSLGVRFMESRTVFDGAFGVIPELWKFRQKNPFIAVAIGKTLGLSALFFAQAHYRLALEDATQINLTGPEVHKKFFGNIDDKFDSYTPADYQFDKNTLVHEIHDSVKSLNQTCRNLITFAYDDEVGTKIIPSASNESEQGAMVLADNHNAKLEELKAQLGEELLEVYPQKSPVVRTYIGKLKDGRRVGYLANPPGHPNNLLTVNAIDKCIAALALFKSMNLPVVSILDCPGGDPRKKESDKDALTKMMQLTHDMIDYPHPKIGVIYGRCFGGSGMFAFPKIFGGCAQAAVRGAQMGVMHKSIIAELLSGSPRLLESWKEIASTEREDLLDMVAAGTIDEIIERNQVGEFIARALTNYSAVTQDLAQPNLLNELKH